MNYFHNCIFYTWADPGRVEATALESFGVHLLFFKGKVGKPREWKGLKPSPKIRARLNVLLGKGLAPIEKPDKGFFTYTFLSGIGHCDHI